MLLLSACASGPTNKKTAASPASDFSKVRVSSTVQNQFNQAIDLLKQGKYEPAINLLKEVVSREKKLPAPFINLAIAYHKTEKLDPAVESLKSALELDPGNAVANNELGLIYRKQGKFQQAREAYEKAIISNPTYLPAIRNLGVLCDIYLQDYRCAYEQFETYLKYEEDETVKIWLADVKRRL